MLAAAAIAFLVIVGLPGQPAAADPAGPTDYRTEVVNISPPTDTIDVNVLGGDSFLQLVVTAGADVRVSGYQGEPYLWFQADGTVLENRAAPTTFLNEERFGTDVPASADADAAPDWVEVADDGSYAWHDHRAHWMQTIRPAGKQPGDQILEAVIPLVVDDVEVLVTVTSIWSADPSPVPVAVGLAAGLSLGVAAWLLARKRQRWPLVLFPAAGLATVMGWVAYTSLPAETGTPITTWLLPATGAAALLVGSILAPTQRFWVAAAAVLGGVQLTLWAWTERDALGAAILPTSAPDWLHRATVAVAAGGGLATIVVGATELRRLLTPAPRHDGGAAGRSTVARAAVGSGGAPTADGAAKLSE